MPGRRAVVIDSFPDSAVRYVGRCDIICVDVLNTCTTILTSLARGRRTYVSASPQSALAFAKSLHDPLLVGEIEGRMPEGFELPDSPAALDRLTELGRPLVIFSSPGTELIMDADAQSTTTYVSSMRNLTATAEVVARRSTSVAVLGAGYHSEFSCEDQMATARIAAALMKKGFEAEDLRTREIVCRWHDADPSLIAWGNSASHLRRANRGSDVDFALSHYDDLPFAGRFEGGEVKVVETSIRPMKHTRSTGESAGVFEARKSSLISWT